MHVKSYCELAPTEIISPNGEAVTLSYYTHAQLASEFNPDGSIDGYVWWRLDSVSNLAGRSISFAYESSDAPSAVGTPPGAAWYRRTSAVFGDNLATISYSYPNATTVLITDAANRTWRISGTGNNIAIRRPGSSTDNFVVTGGAGGVTSVVNNGVTTAYNRVATGGSVAMTITYAPGQTQVVQTSESVGRPASITDPLGRVTSFAYDANRRLTRTTFPEGNYREFTLDGRGNATQIAEVGKPGSGVATLVTTASYPSSCTNPVTCNQPEWTRDAKGNQTDYTYDALHGGVLTVKAPAAPNGVRPETRYTYSAVSGVQLVTGVATCRTAATCAGGADESKTAVIYSANLQPISVTQSAGDGSLTRTAAATYDAIGNMLTVDGPLAGSADSVRYRYNGARQVVGVIGPDPDGGGSLQHRAVRMTYNADGQPTLVENGRVADQSDTAWTNFTALRQTASSYDANARKIADRVQSGGTTFALTSYGYDSLGRLECTARRMNPATFASPPAACSLAVTGSFGPDRITRTIYDAAGQITKLQSAVGTADQTDEVTVTYTNNGQQSTLTDGENNVSVV